MADKTHIAWTDASWPLVVGCDRVSSGCAHCYAIRSAHRMAGNPNPKISSVYEGLTERQPNGQLDWTGTVRCVEERLDWPLKWRSPRRIFVTSLGDLFHPAVPAAFLSRVFEVMEQCPQHEFQLLTKRPERMRVFLMAWTGGYHYDPAKRVPEPYCRPPLPNVWLGVSVENQRAAGERIPLLLDTPAAVRWVSAEPLLGPVDLSKWLYLRTTSRIDWVVCGGESGPDFRPMDEQWVRDIRDQCQAAGVAFYFKQGAGPRPGLSTLLDGREWREYPKGLGEGVA